MTRPDLMTVECRTCPVRELHCDDCMVPVLLGISSSRTDTALDPEERAVVTRLVRAGLVDAETATAARARLDQGVAAAHPGSAVG